MELPSTRHSGKLTSYLTRHRTLLWDYFAKNWQLGLFEHDKAHDLFICLMKYQQFFIIVLNKDYEY